MPVGCGDGVAPDGGGMWHAGRPERREPRGLRSPDDGKPGADCRAQGLVSVRPAASRARPRPNRPELSGDVFVAHVYKDIYFPAPGVLCKKKKCKKTIIFQLHALCKTEIRIKNRKKTKPFFAPDALVAPK